MNDYIQITFSSVSNEQKEILIAELSAVGFEGFEETSTGLNAFIFFDNLDEKALTEITGHQSIGFNKKIIEETNWNAVWESNFDPVIVDDFVGIRADFHPPIKGVEHEIVITPKMSFGTGHHATTYMMIQGMRKLDFKGKSVFDFGTGTGVLAILAEKLGAKRIVAVDHDDWSMENAHENIERNKCSLIDLAKLDSAAMNSSFDIILANINKNVILDNFHLLVKQLAENGHLFLCGLLQEDEEGIFHKKTEYSLHLIHRSTRDNWLFLSLSH